jgi:tetratricopeptide (TPR) repeat protein
VFFSLRSHVLILIVIAQVACQRQTAGPPPRYAVLRFENLSGDPALDWAGRAASETLGVSLALDGPVLSPSAIMRTGQLLGPRPSTAPGISAERQEALLAGANRLISGTIERAGGQILITATERDTSTGKTLRIISAQDSSVVKALATIARQFSTNPKLPPTSNETALRLYATALESSVADGANGSADLVQAIQLDPDFGAAWIALASLQVSKGDRAAVEDVIGRARRQKLDPLSLAKLDLELANLKPDQSARLQALRKVASLSPGDTILLRTVAEAEMSQGQFQQSAEDWRKLTAALPDDPSTWNSLGYTLSYAGDYKGAMAALQEYARIRPHDANAYDSIGDLNYSFRKFKEASESYTQAGKIQPDFQRYGDLYKAAWAKFNANDKPGADASFAQFRAAREKLSDTLIPLMTADWLYRTGREREAIDSLRNTVAGTQSEAVRVNGYAQLTLWDLIGHDRAQAVKDAFAMGPKALDTGALVVRFAAMPSASAAEWETRATQFFPPAMGALRPLALGYALILDAKHDAAVTVWGQIVQKTPATDFMARAIYTRLQGKPQDRPLLPDPGIFNQFLAVLYSL